MRVFAFVLVIFTVFLTLIPCEDEIPLTNVDQPVALDREHHGHEHQEGVDYCTPFCVCSINYSEKLTPVIEEEAIENESEAQFLYLEPNSIQAVKQILHPPQG